MNKEKLEARLQVLIKERDAQMAAYEGAIQDCKYWLKELDVQTDTDIAVEPTE